MRGYVLKAGFVCFMKDMIEFLAEKSTIALLF